MAMVEGLFSASSTFVQGLLTPMSANKSKCHTTPLRAGSAEEVEVEEEKEEGEDDEEPLRRTLNLLLALKKITYCFLRSVRTHATTVEMRR